MMLTVVDSRSIFCVVSVAWQEREEPARLRNRKKNCEISISRRVTHSSPVRGGCDCANFFLSRMPQWQRCSILAHALSSTTVSKSVGLVFIVQLFFGYECLLRGKRRFSRSCTHP